jgi:protein-L-isoaspartate(D-aspartate) O-methyltransferase
MDAELLRRFYAEEVRVCANVRTRALVEAFTRVRREKFLGPGPWLIGLPGVATSDYWTTEDADPAHVYHNVVIAIDPEKRLNNGQPSSLAMWMDALELKPKARVLHVGCATGYYSAILAEAVGAEGRVWAIDVEPELAAKAGANLADLPQVSVACADGWEFDPGECDAIFINAGATHPHPRWLASLAPGGVLVVPITVVFPGITHSSGMVLKVTRTGDCYRASFISPVSIYPLATGRSEEWNSRFAKALGTRQWAQSNRFVWTSMRQMKAASATVKGCVSPNRRTQTEVCVTVWRSTPA